MTKVFSYWLNAGIFGLFLSLSSCAITPTSIVKQPTTSRPDAAVAPERNTGAIFRNAGFRPMFEDRRPRYVGDIVTVNVVENTSANKAGGNSGSKDGEVDASITSFLGKAIPRATFGASSSSSFEDSANANASNRFSGAVTATVVEVLPNGYLVISGEKQIGLDRGTEFVRFSGVINPDTIALGNMVRSTQIADARIEYRTNSKLDASEVVSMFARFFLSISAL